MLRFHARPGHVCAWPGQRHSGQIRRYIGRDHKVERNEKGEVSLIGHPAQKEPVEIDPASEDGRRVLRLMRIESDKPLIPADRETAKACGVPFVEVEWIDGEFHPKAQAAAVPAESPAKSGKAGKS